MRVLGFNEVSNASAGGQFSAGAQAREWADHARPMGDKTIDIAMRLDHGAGGEP